MLWDIPYIQFEYIMQGIYHGVLSVPRNIVVGLNNVMMEPVGFGNTRILIDYVQIPPPVIVLTK
jgi:hypothetical protein